MSLEGRVALITGSSRGIGKASALALARAGADIVVVARSERVADPRLPGTIYETAEEVRALGRRALPLKCNIGNADEVDETIAAALAEFGKVDILLLVAAAGMMSALADLPMSRWDLMQQANLRATVQLVKGVLPGMREQHWGHIATVSPKPGRVPPASGPGLGLGLAKATQTLFILGAAEELAGYGIAANTLYVAGGRDTYGRRSRRPQEPAPMTADLFADAVVALVSQDPGERYGQALDDEEVLIAAGVTDFSRYAVVRGE